MNDFTDIVSKAMEVRPDEGDYTGEDGLLYPYGIITTNRKSPVYQGFSVIWQGFSSFSKPKNRAAK